MKKLLAIATCASAVAAFGTDVELELGQIGVTAVTSSTTNTIVAVSYTDLDTGNVTASNLVKTTNLTIGDYLYIYNNGDFSAFELMGDDNGVKYWEGVSTVGPASGGIATVTEAIASDAEGARVAVGKGVWLVRGSKWDGNSFTFYLYGKPVNSYEPVTVSAGSSALVGNPTQTTKAPTFTAGPNNGDKIIIPVGGGFGTRTLTYNSSLSTWGYRENGKRKQVETPSITAGTGFWYVVPSGGSAVTFTW